MRIFLSITALALFLNACTKHNTAAPPAASFSITGDSLGSAIVMATYDQYPIIDNSTNAGSWHWDFGNDSSSSQQNPVLWYPKSGTYTLTETVQDQYGRKSTATRQVKVLDRVIRQVTITGLTPFIAPVDHSLDGASVWAVIKLGPDNTSYPFPTVANQSFNAPIIYQSPVVANVDSLQLPIYFTIPGKLIVDFPALTGFLNQAWGYKGVGYGLELYAKDNSGTYLLSSSYQTFYDSQSGSISIPVADIQKGSFVMRYVNITVNCDYE